MTNQFDLVGYHRRLPEILVARYGRSFEVEFKALSKRYKEVEKGRDLKVEDVMAIFDDSLPFVTNWTKPDPGELADRMRSSKVAGVIKNICRLGYDEAQLKLAWECFRELSLTALVLHHACPSRFAMCSHHLASTLSISAPTVTAFYLKYCKELKAWSDRRWGTPGSLSVADTEMALWAWYRLANYGEKNEKKKHRERFVKDKWIQDRKAAQIADSLGAVGKLDLARHYLEIDPTVSAMIAWRELEWTMRRLHPYRDHLPKKTTFQDLINGLPETMFPRNLTRSYVWDLWRRRNDVMHEGEEITVHRTEDPKTAAGTVLNGVTEFLAFNS